MIENFNSLKIEKTKKKKKKGKRRIIPTTRQKALAYKIIENLKNGTNEPMQTTMLKLGYSKSSAKTSTMIVNGQGFLQVMEKMGINDELLSEVLKDGLKAEKKTYFFGKVIDTEPDHYARHRYLDTALKVKGHMKLHDEQQNAGDPASRTRELRLMVKETFKE